MTITKTSIAISSQFLAVPAAVLFAMALLMSAPTGINAQSPGVNATCNATFLAEQLRTCNNMTLDAQFAAIFPNTSAAIFTSLAQLNNSVLALQASQTQINSTVVDLMNQTANMAAHQNATDLRVTSIDSRLNSTIAGLKKHVYFDVALNGATGINITKDTTVKYNLLVAGSNQSGIDMTSGVFTAPMAGTYVFIFSGFFRDTNIAPQTHSCVAIRKNRQINMAVACCDVANNLESAATSTIMSLAANETVDTAVLSNGEGFFPFPGNRTHFIGFSLE